jgi:cyanophycinase
VRRLVVGTMLLLVADLVGATDPPKGHLVLIGGGEKPDVAMQKFVELAGGPEAPIVAIPTASTDDDVGTYYTTLFAEKYGCPHVVTLDIRTRDDALRPDFVALAEKATGIFFGGGDQVRILAALEGTPVLDALSRAFRRGAVVGGTSAGTACQSGLMITGEGDFKVVRTGSVELRAGLGFFSDVVVDQHFIARQRSNRLLSVILEHPDLLGVGVDEDTAIWVRPDGTFQVLGESSVMVFDASGAVLGCAPGDNGRDLLGVHDLKVHILLPGETFDIKARKVVAGPAPAVR